MLVGDLLRSYSLGIKTLYYQNTYDGKGDEEIVSKSEEINDDDLDAEIAQLLAMTEDCESCKM